MKLEIQNFQSIEHAELEFKPGITCIVGCSNSGKTAIQRALRALILNNVSSSKVEKYLTHGKDQIDIKLTLDDSTTYEYIKSSKGTAYNIIDNTTGEIDPNEKCGNNDIFDYDKNFPFVVRDKQLINTHTEKDGLPFPFNLNDVELFKIFEELYNISSSSTIFKKLKSLETQTNTEVNRVKEDIQTNKNNIEFIIEVEDKFDIEKLENIKERAEKVQAGMIGLDEDISTARSNNKISKAIKLVLDVHKPIEETEKKLNKISSLINEINDLQKDIRIVNSNNKIESINVYKKDFNTDVIEPFKALSSDYKLLKSLENDIKESDEEIKDYQEELAEAKSELDQIEACPLCGQPLKKGHKHE